MTMCSIIHPLRQCVSLKVQYMLTRIREIKMIFNY